MYQKFILIMATIVEIKGKKEIKYKAVVRIKGYSTKCKYFKRKTDAKIWAKAIETSMENGSFKDTNSSVVSGGTTIKTVGDLITYFQENEAPDRYSYHEKYNIIYEWWKDKIGNVKCSDLNSAILSDCKRTLINENSLKPNKGNLKRSNSTINKYLMALSAVLTFGKKEYKLWDYNPMHDVEKRKLPDLRTRFLSEEEVKILKTGARKKSYMLYVFILIALTTGARYAEILNLNVENIDFKNNRIHYLNTKNGTNRGAPVNKKLLIKIKVLMRVLGIKDGHIFINKKTKKLVYLKGQFENLIKELGIKDFRFHDLRHTAASYLLMEGATIIELMEIFGWKSQTMVRRYAHLSKTHTTLLVNKVSDKLLNI